MDETKKHVGKDDFTNEMKKYVDDAILHAMVVIVFAILVGPPIFMFIIYLITGYSYPKGLSNNETTVLLFVCEAFSFSGWALFAYVIIRRAIKWFSNKGIPSRTSPKKGKNSTNDEL